MAFTPCGLQIPGPNYIPLQYGLLSVAEEIIPTDRHWEGGITWDDDYCSDVHSTTGFCPIPATGSIPKIADKDFESCCAEPFIVYASYDCPPVGKEANAAFEIAKKRLALREEREVERVFWTGITDSGAIINPALSSGNSGCGAQGVNLTPCLGPVGIIESMGVLESALGECSPGIGVIHANYGVASLLAANHLIFERNGAWYTVTGQRLAIGAGYPGTGPDNMPAADGTTWIYGTGPVFVMRSEVFLTPERFKEAFDHTLNNVTVYAERAYALGWSCCLFAIQVSLCS